MTEQETVARQKMDDDVTLRYVRGHNVYTAYVSDGGAWILKHNCGGTPFVSSFSSCFPMLDSMQKIAPLSEWQDLDDDDTPAMPTLEDALARLAMESPEAARAARNFLEGTSELRTVWVRFRVSERERTQIDEGMRAAGVEKISEYCRGKVLG